MSLRGRPELADVWCRWKDGLQMQPDGSAAEAVTPKPNCGSAAEDGLRWRSVCFARKGGLPGRSCGSAAEDVTQRQSCGSACSGG